MLPPPEIGAFTVLEPADPAAGAQWLQAVPDHILAKILLVEYDLVTDVAVANRYPGISVTNAKDLPDYKAIGSATFTASVSRTVQMQPGLALAAYTHTDWYFHGGPPNMWVMGGGTITSFVRQLQAGDQISNVKIHLQYWPYNSTDAI